MFEHVQSPQLADAGGDLGYRVRAGHFTAKADGATTVAQVQAAGYKSSVIYTGWDGDENSSENDQGPWKLEVLTIDPKEFRGDLTSSFGPNLEDREKTSQLAAASGALAATNGGYIVMDPAAGAPGDPAGAAVHDGKVLSEPVGDRPSLVIGAKNETSIQRLHWNGTVTAPGNTATRSGRIEPGAGPHPQLRRHRRHSDEPAAARLHLHRRERDRRLHPRLRRFDTVRSRT